MWIGSASSAEQPTIAEVLRRLLARSYYLAGRGTIFLEAVFPRTRVGLYRPYYSHYRNGTKAGMTT